MQTNVLIKEEYILKNRNTSCPYKKLSVFYNSCLKTFGSHLVFYRCAFVRLLLNIKKHILTKISVLCCISTVCNYLYWKLFIYVHCIEFFKKFVVCHHLSLYDVHKTNSCWRSQTCVTKFCNFYLKDFLNKHK